MYSSIRNMYLTVLLSTIIILLNTDLSCLKPYLTTALKAIETRRDNDIYNKQYMSTTLPDRAILVRYKAFNNMATYIESNVVFPGNVFVDKNLGVSVDTSCRGSPLNRSP